MEETRTINVNLQTAQDWYKKGGDWRTLVLTIYSKEELDPSIPIYYENILEKFKKNYPIGTIVWNVDGTDHYPNIILSEPWLEETIGLYSKNEKEVVFKTARLYIYGEELQLQKMRLSKWRGGFNDGCIKSKSFVFEEYRKTYADMLSSAIRRHESDLKACLDRAESDRKEIEQDQKILDNFDTIYNKLVEEAKKHYEHGNNKADNR